MSETGAAKEATILGMSEALNASLQGLQQLMLSSFDRVQGKVEGVEVAPHHPNVLDEIMAKLADGQAQIKVIRGILQEALGKLS